MDVPIRKQSRFLIVSIQTVLTDRDLEGLCDRVVDEVEQQESGGVVLDVTGLDVIDSFSVRTLQHLAEMIHARGCETVIVGIQPDVAYAMDRIGYRLEGITTAGNVDEGLAQLGTGHPQGHY